MSLLHCMWQIHFLHASQCSSLCGRCSVDTYVISSCIHCIVIMMVTVRFCNVHMLFQYFNNVFNPHLHLTHFVYFLYSLKIPYKYTLYFDLIHPPLPPSNSLWDPPTHLPQDFLASFLILNFKHAVCLLYNRFPELLTLIN